MAAFNRVARVDDDLRRPAHEVVVDRAMVGEDGDAVSLREQRGRERL
jgi:hypothetical protein